MDDEDVADSWEEAADSGVSSLRDVVHSSKLVLPTITSRSSPMRTAIVIQDDSLPAAPPPQIRILKRPTNNGTASSSASSSRPQQTKTLAQREAEYAEARRRILGSASSEEMPTRLNVQQPSEPARPNNYIIRQPTGPDGTTGFRLCR
uniref:SUZ RNA-binding domain-containing n=1 Tax=Periophthalmus magnuspinnatus TaxID=409849 RepID=A0A3B3ZI36_9GOBI